MVFLKFSLLLFFHIPLLPWHLPISINLSIMPCSTVSSLDSNTSSSAYFTMWMIHPPLLKSPNPSRASLVSHSLYKLNTIGDKQRPCLTPIPIFTLLVSPRFSRTLTLCAMHKFPINLLSRQSTPVTIRICINLVQLTRPTLSASLWSKHTVLRLSPSFDLMLFSASQLHSSFLFLFQIQTDILHVHPPYSFRSFFKVSLLISFVHLYIKVKYFLTCSSECRRKEVSINVDIAHSIGITKTLQAFKQKCSNPHCTQLSNSAALYKQN